MPVAKLLTSKDVHGMAKILESLGFKSASGIRELDRDARFSSMVVVRMILSLIN